MSQDHYELPEQHPSDASAMFSERGTPDTVLSGSELLSHNLPQARRGFDPEATEALLARAARTIDALYEQVWRVTEEHNATLAEMERLGSQPAAPAPVVGEAPESSRILAAAERTASEVVAQANAEAEIIRARAAQERSRGEAEIAEIRRQAQDALRRAQADAAARRAELADEVRDAELEAERRMAESRDRLAEVDRSFDSRRSELEQELARLQASSTRVREELAQQLEAFRAHARNERDAAVLELLELAESVRNFDPSITEVVADGRFTPPAIPATSPWATDPVAPVADLPVELPAEAAPEAGPEATDSAAPAPWDDAGAPAGASWDDPEWSASPAAPGAPEPADTVTAAEAPAEPVSAVAAPAEDARRRLWGPPVAADAVEPSPLPAALAGDEAAADDTDALQGFRQVDSFRPEGFTQVPSYDVAWPAQPE